MHKEDINGYRLSPQQAQLWEWQREEPRSSYSAQCAVLIDGALDVAALKTALECVAARHEILRTSFQTLAALDMPLQVIEDEFAVRIEEHDLSAKTWPEQEAAISSMLEALRQRPSALDQRAFREVSLLTLAEGRYALLLSLPALCADAHALRNLVRDIHLSYAACHDETVRQEAEPLQYVDFSEWQNELLGDEDATTGKEYWHRQKIKSAAHPSLPFESQHQASPAFHPNAYRLKLDASVSERVRKLSERYGTNKRIFLLACWHALLWRLTGETELAVGLSSERREEEFKGALGLFSKSLPVHFSFEDGLSFGQLLRVVQQKVEEVESWQDYFTGEQMEAGAAAVQSMPGSSFSAFGFEFVEWPAEERGAATGWTLGWQFVCIGPFKIKLSCACFPGLLAAEFLYNAESFREEEIRRLAGQFKNCLESILDQPETPIEQLRLLSAEDLQQLLGDFNQTARVYAPPLHCLHRLFEEQAARTPASVAVIFDDEQVSYAELNERANRLAQYLLAQGAGPEKHVGILLERSIEMVVALLGVLKAGAAYVPLDSSYPAERLSYLIEDAHIELILTQEWMLDTLAPEPVPRLICMRRDWPLIDRLLPENIQNNVTPENLAYVIYTSGSTGQPKGVMVSHRAICNRLLWMQDAYPLTEHDRVLQKTPFTFDASIWEFFVPLFIGATLIMARPEGHRDSAYLVQAVIENQITTLQLVPSMLQLLLETPGLENCHSLKRLFCGGEALSFKLHKRFYSRLKAQLYNLYGPTEASIDATSRPCPQTDEPTEPGAIVPIGRPIANMQVYVLDRHLKPCPIWIAGELHIAGVGLARGYLDRPDLTSERFIPNPFGPEPGTRLYRTGDLARFLPDGQVEFLGRIDHQVKIRGYRIELGEIEAALANYPHVRQTVLIAREDEPGEKRLVAYVVAGPEEAPTPAELQSFLRESLPDYMVPSAFVLLDAMPTTSSGKIDRKALPAPQETDQGAESFAAPRTAVEEMLAGIWSELLHIERIGIKDNFFYVGGHSLLATQLIARVRELFQVEIPLRTIFTFPTLAELATAIEAALRNKRGLSLPPIKSVSRDHDLPLSYAQQRLWFINQLDPNSTAYNLPAAVRLEGRLDVAALTETFRGIIRRHEVLRTTFALKDGQPVQLISPEISFDLPVINLSHLPEDAREREALRRAAVDAGCPFDLKRGPLLRACLLRLCEDEHVLLFTMHHIISDGWSLGVLVREVAALYAAYAQGTDATLPELQIQYADYAVWQRQWLTGEVLNNQLSYWREQLRGAPAVLELPTDHLRPPVQSFRGAHHKFSLSEELSRELQELSRRHGVTLFMTLLATFQVLLSRYSGQQDVVIGTPIASRTLPQTEGLIGFFVNTLVLRGRVSPGESFLDVLHRARETSLGAYAHQDVPFEKLVEELAPERLVSHSPLFQVMLVLQNVPWQEQEMGGLLIEELEAESQTSNFDLTLALAETPGGLVANLEYNPDLFEPQTIERMAEHLRLLLAGVVANPQQRVSDLPLLTENEHALLLCEWNQTQAQYPEDACFHQLFEQQVELSPQAAALIYQNEQLTYRQLNERANRLAHHLRGQGVGPEVRVGIALERSVELMISLLAVLKAGGAYVPLDPANPSERINFMLEDAQVKLVLTQERLRGRFSPEGVRLLCVDADEDVFKQERADNLANLTNRTTPDNLAYVIYTSGSTGRPKGVMIPHRGLVNYLHWCTRAYRVGKGCGSVVHSSVGFDLSITSLFSPLLAGRCVVLAAEGHGIEPLSEALRAGSRFSLIKLTPQHLKALGETLAADEAAVASQALIIGGEALYEESLTFWRRYAPQTRLINEYGPTETVVGCCVYEATAERARAGAVAIGRPIANTKLFILDTAFHPVPIGVAGELYVGGVGLGRGYLNRPELTAQAFVPNPFSVEAGARLYRTGDVARYLPDGNLEFLGRVDHQVKIRSYRIELGEIEVALGSHPSVREAAVTLREDAEDKRLVAYVVTDALDQLEIKNELRGYLLERLPEYMVPGAFVKLEEMPLTANGKVDRKALPAPGDARPKLERHYVAPSDYLERELARVWEELLNVSPVGATDDFFELGGHSILAITLMARIRKKFGLKLPLSLMFPRATIQGLAGVMRQQKVGVPPESPLVAIQPNGQKRPFFCVHPASGSVLCYADLSRHLGPDQPFYGLQSTDDLTDALARQPEKIAASYIKAMQAVQMKGPYLLGAWSMGGLVAYEMARQLREEGHKVDLLALFDTRIMATPESLSGEDQPDHLLRLAQEFEEQLPVPLRDFQRLGRDEQLSCLYQLAVKARLIPADLGLEQVERTLANLRTWSSYVPRGYAGPLTLFLASEQPQDRPDLSQEWRQLALGGLSIQTVPGNHMTMVTEPQVLELAQRLNECIERTQTADFAFS